MNKTIDALMDAPITIEIPAKFLAMLHNVMSEEMRRTALAVMEAKLSKEIGKAQTLADHGLCVLDVLDCLDEAIDGSPVMQEILATDEVRQNAERIRAERALAAAEPPKNAKFN